MIAEKELLSHSLPEAPSPRPEAKTVLVDVCPDCGSTRIRWRKRRFYDVVFTWISAGMLSSGLYAQYDDGFWPTTYDNDVMLAAASISWETPKRFSRCLDCGHRGFEG